MAASIRKRTWTTRKGEEKTAWVVDYTDNQGERRNKNFPTRKAADSWLVTARGEVAQGIHTPASTSITVATAGENWIDQATADGLERATIRQYRQHLDLHIEPFIGKTRLAELSPGDVKAFRNRLIAEGRSSNVAKRVVSSLGAILADAVSSGHVARNVVREQAKLTGRRGLRLEKRHKKLLVVGEDIPTKAEVRTLLDAATGYDRALLAVVVFTGLRSSELRALPWSAVDLSRATVTVRRRADRWGTLSAPKSEAARREVPLPPFVVNTLREWKLACPSGKLDLVFPTRKGGVMDMTNLHRRLGALEVSTGITPLPPLRTAHPTLTEEQIAEKACLHPRYGLHAFRHAFASLYIEQGYTPKRIQTLMGHATAQMTFDTYGHLFPAPDSDQVAARKLQMQLLGS